MIDFNIILSIILGLLVLGLFTYVIVLASKEIKECFGLNSNFSNIYNIINKKWRNSGNQNDGSIINNLPLTEFYVKSSHNSYLSGWQILGNSNTKNIEYVLDNGYRHIELDIHKFTANMINQIQKKTNWLANILTFDLLVKDKLPADTTPVVMHGNETFGDISSSGLLEMLSIVERKAFEKTSDPLIINLEIFDSNNAEYMKNIRDILVKTLGKYLYEISIKKRYEYNDKIERHPFKIPISQLQNKIIIAINHYGMNWDNYLAYLDDIVHCRYEGYLENGMMLNKSEKENRQIYDHNIFIRSYPDNVFTSKNYDPEGLISCGYNAISLNAGNKTEDIAKIDRMFTLSGYVPKHAEIYFDGYLSLPDNFNATTKHYKNFFSMNAIIKTKTSYNQGRWHSLDGRYVLEYQTDGNLVIYKGGKSTWASNTSGNQNAKLEMQVDGNLVIYNNNGKAIWASGTSGITGAYAKIENNGKLTIHYANSPIAKTIN